MSAARDRAHSLERGLADAPNVTPDSLGILEEIRIRGEEQQKASQRDLYHDGEPEQRLLLLRI